LASPDAAEAGFPPYAADGRSHLKAANCEAVFEFYKLRSGGQKSKNTDKRSKIKM
jgi:hypothetical protein